MSTYDGTTTALSRLLQNRLLNICARRCAICHMHIDIGETNECHRGSSLSWCPQIYGDDFGCGEVDDTRDERIAQFSSAVFHLVLADVDVPVFEASKANQVNALVEFAHLT